MAINNKPLLAVIPARAGSKGLPGKNMLKVMGIPLVGYTIDSAINSKYIDEIFLTSDDKLTLTYGKKVGINIISRPKEFSDDMASANDVVQHFITMISEELIKKDPYIIYLQPTSPLRTATHIDDSLERMLAARIDKLISVVKLETTPYKAFILDSKDRLKALFSESMTNQRRQDLPQVFLPNGAIYVFKLSDFCEHNLFPSNGSFPYIMNESESLDIDNENDLEVFSKTIE